MEHPYFNEFRIEEREINAKEPLICDFEENGVEEDELPESELRKLIVE